MSILEKIVNTETQVQNDIKKAGKKAEKLITDAREKGNGEALKLRSEADLEIEKINKKVLKESAKIDEELSAMLATQGEELIKSVEKNTKSIVDKMIKEAIEI